MLNCLVALGCVKYTWKIFDFVFECVGGFSEEFHATSVKILKYI